MDAFSTTHALHTCSAVDLARFDDGTVDLVVTSPPYPMIAMWDDIFAQQDPVLAEALQRESAYELMHQLLDRTWRECYRLLRPGGFACINIGDATRTVKGVFRLYTNHSRITAACEELGFHSLPAVIWRKQTNAPNKFMGSGMLPAGAYVTLEHEYILIFRKGEKRDFSGTARAADAAQRRRSSFFWEERNQWFSDLWDFKGVQQRLGNAEARSRSGAFPLELPFRLINMYSMQGDTVLDPFAGTGTTMLAAAAAGRNSLGIEIDPTLGETLKNTLLYEAALLNARQAKRLADHAAFVEEYRQERDHHFKHHNALLDTPVMTGQEKEMELPGITGVELAETGGAGAGAPGAGPPGAGDRAPGIAFRVTHGPIQAALAADTPNGRPGRAPQGQLDLGLDP